MNITYKETKLFNSEDLVELFTSVGWVEYSAAYPDRLLNAMYYSDVVFSAWDGDELIGLLSAIDDSMHVYIVYLLVNPKYQNKGIGKELLHMCIEHYANYKIILTTDEETKEYYEKLGFSVDSIGLIKFDLH